MSEPNLFMPTGSTALGIENASLKQQLTALRTALRSIPRYQGQVFFPATVGFYLASTESVVLLADLLALLGED